VSDEGLFSSKICRGTNTNFFDSSYGYVRSEQTCFWCSGSPVVIAEEWLLSCQEQFCCASTVSATFQEQKTHLGILNSICRGPRTMHEDVVNCCNIHKLLNFDNVYEPQLDAMIFLCEKAIENRRNRNENGSMCV